VSAVERGELLSRSDLRRLLGWALVAGLSLAALTACVAILNGSFGETEGRVIGMSVGFAVFSATGAAGMSLRLRSEAGRLRELGTGTVLVAAVAYVLLVAAIWQGSSSDDLWELWGVAALLSLASSHASLILGARRSTDTPAIGLLIVTSLATSAFDTSIGILAILGQLGDVGEGMAELAAITVVLLLLSTALPPILRRLTVDRPAPAGSEGIGRAAPALGGGMGLAVPVPDERHADDVAVELAEIAARIEGLADRTGAGSAELRWHAERLRASASRLS
jgi:hypothetical protein